MTALVPSPTPAAERAERIRSGFRTLADWQQDVIDAYRERDWLTLGYPTWDAYLDGEFGETRVLVPREQRRQIVADMREVGMSTRAIGAALGVSVGTVQADRSELNSRTETRAEAADVIGLDGRRRPATQPPVAKQTETTKTEQWFNPTTGEQVAPPAAPHRQSSRMAEINAATPPEVKAEFADDARRGVALLEITDACADLAKIADPEDRALHAPAHVADAVATVRPAIDVLTRFLTAWENR